MFVKPIKILIITCLVTLFHSIAIPGAAGQTPAFPVDWSEVIETVKLYDSSYPKTVCKKCQREAEEVVRRAKKLQAYLTAIDDRSFNFPNKIGDIKGEQSDLAEFQKELQQKLSRLAKIKKQAKALIEKLDRQSSDAQYSVGNPGETNSEPTDSSVVEQAVNTGAYFVETFLRVSEYFVNGKTANSYLDAGSPKELREKLRKNSKEINNFWSLSGNGKVLKLFNVALSLEKEIRQLQELIKDLNQTIVTPAQFRQLESLYAAFQQALAKQVLCERKYQKECEKTGEDMPPVTDWSEYALEDGADVDTDDLIEKPMPGLIPEDYVDPLDDPGEVIVEEVTLAPPKENTTGNVIIETLEPGGNIINTLPGTITVPLLNPTTGPPPVSGELPEGFTQEEFDATKKQLEAILKANPNPEPRKFRAFCETVSQICERYRGQARSDCLASDVIKQEVASCRAVEGGKTCQNKCALIADRIRAGEVLRGISLNELRQQIPFAAQIMSARVAAQNAKIIAANKELAEIMQAANTPPLVIYQDALSGALQIVGPEAAALPATMVPIGPLRRAPTGAALVRQKQLTVERDAFTDELRRLKKQARALERRIFFMRQFWVLDKYSEQCTAANAEKMRQDCVIECNDGPIEDLYQLKEGLLSYSSCFKHKIELPLGPGTLNFYTRHIYLDVSPRADLPVE